MVRKKMQHQEIRRMYLLKTGQTLENTKVPERTRALIVPRNTFERFINYTTEEDRIAKQQEKKAAEMAALKIATYEKSKMWDSKIENIKARRREELLSKRQKAEEERKTFVKEVAEKKAAERLEVVQQAMRMLMLKKPLCRRINRALLASECLRELDAQIAFQKTIKAMDKEQDAEYANSIKTNIAKYEEQRKQEAEEQTKKTRNYKMELKKQIEENERNNKLKAAEKLKAEKQNQRDMTRNMQLIKAKEMQDILNKKKKLEKLFKEAIEEKKQFELELKRDEEFEDRVLEIHRNAKDRIQKIHKSVMLKEKEEKARQIQITEDAYSAFERFHEVQVQEQKILEKAVKEEEMAEAEKRKAQKEREEMMRALMEEYKLQNEAVKTKHKQEEKDLKTWEIMQRFKRNEYDKQNNLEEHKQQRQRKLEYGNELRNVAEEKQIEKKHEEVLEIKATNTKAAIEKANQRILLYGNEVLEESMNVRPLYPIIKAIEECKKEMGLRPTKKIVEAIKAERPRKKHGGRRMCTKPVPSNQIYYLQ